jgi:hypothetical protein
VCGPVELLCESPMMMMMMMMIVLTVMLVAVNIYIYFGCKLFEIE